MGAGGRMDPSRVKTADLQDTFGDPFAANIRRCEGVVACVQAMRECVRECVRA
jgi:hypothetical protein